MISTLLAILILGAVFGLTLWAGFAMIDEVLKTGETVDRGELARELFRTGALRSADEQRWLAGNSVWPNSTPHHPARWCRVRKGELPPHAECTCGPWSTSTPSFHATFYGKAHRQ